ncbi:MAG: EamA family transporter [Deltaproteobacteria bacterium]|nr:EamA family transporter [Deltaproteobacteria bacterium]
MLWSTWGIAVKFLEINEYYVIFYTSLFTLPFLTLYNGLRRPRDCFQSLKRGFLVLALLALSLLLNNYFYFAAFNRTTIAISVFTHYTAPLFVVLLAPLLLAESFEKRLIFPLGIASFGLAAVLFPDFCAATAQPLQLGGALFGLASGVAYAFTLIFAKKLAARLPTLDLILWQSFFMVMFLLPFFSQVRAPMPSRPAVWLLLLLLSLSHCILAPFLYLDGLRGIKAQHAAIIGYLEPLAAVSLGLVINHERPSGWIWVGGSAIILSGALTASRSGRQKVKVKS